MPSLLIDIRKSFDSGIGRYIRSVVPAFLEATSWRVVLMCNSQGQYLQFRDSLRLRHELPFVVCRYRSFSMKNFLTLHRIADKYDYFWAPSLSFPLLGRSRLIVTVHDLAQLDLVDLRDPISTLRFCVFWVLLFIVSRRASVILFISIFTSRRFFSYFSLKPAQRWQVIHNGVDHAYWQGLCSTCIGSQPSLPSPVLGEKYFMGVGNLRPHKNIETAIKAFSKLALHLDVEFLWIGACNDHGYSEYLHNMLTVSGISGRWHFVGLVSDQELACYYSKCLALVFPSLYEGFGLPILEAMVCGASVISASSASLPEVGGDSCHYFSARNSEQLSSLMSTFLVNKHGKVSSSLQSYLRGFSWQTTAVVISEFLAEYHASASPPRSR